MMTMMMATVAAVDLLAQASHHTTILLTLINRSAPLVFLLQLALEYRAYLVCAMETTTMMMMMTETAAAEL